ncbi:Serine/threonine-protein phosphatase BSU1 [Diplonema papillatum]|nr:Serine/threonine-protein phosphatase BSU1 [Diplonema papillatum]
MSAFTRVKEKEEDERMRLLVEENGRLKEELRQLKLSQQQQLLQQQQRPGGYTKYHMSNHVVVIHSKTNKAEKVPLLKILMDSNNRVDRREADTPVYGPINADEQQHAEERKRILQLVKESGAMSEASGPRSDGSDRPDEPPPSPPPPAPAPASTRRRPAPLSKGALQMTNNGIVSTQTLKAFQESWGAKDGSRSPSVSMVADSLIDYLNNGFAAQGFMHSTRPGTSDAFGRHVIAICSEVVHLLKQEPLQLTLQSPIYVFGDIHGNFGDLHYFLSELILFRNLKYTPHNFLFLGDYVDRGRHGVECVAMLLALKVISPTTLFLLRGNHEDRLVNGDVRTYGRGSLKAQCHQQFGQILGENVWMSINSVFKWLPLTATIDNTIFCTHGGIPRFSGGPDGRMSRMQDTFKFPRFETFFECGPNEPPHIQECRQIAADICWSDPCEDEVGLDPHGFGPNPRGHGIVVFGSKAVDEFLAVNNLQYIFRAHQEKSDGVKVSKNSRVVTIFSSSDYIGHQNGAGVVFVSHTGAIRLIIKEAREEQISPPEEPNAGSALAPG